MSKAKLDWTTVGQQPQSPKAPVPDGASQRQSLEKDVPAAKDQHLLQGMRLVRIKVSSINVGKRFREANLTKVQEIAESIQSQGLMNPPLIDNANNLVAGLHRYLAVKDVLHWVEVECFMSDKTDQLDLELQQIDENIMREELHYIDRGKFFQRRKEIYEIKHPETKLGGATQLQPRSTGGKFAEVPESGKPATSAPTFTEETSQKTGISKTTIKEEVQIARDVIPEAQPLLKEQCRPKGDALELARQSPKVQKKVTELMPDRPNVPVKNLVKEVKREEKKEEILKTLPPAPAPSAAPLLDYKMLWGDAFKVLANPGIIKPESIHLIVTSTPYGVGKTYLGAGDWDQKEWPSLLKRFVKLAKRALVGDGVLVMNLGTQPQETRTGITEYVPLDTIAVPIAREEGLYLLRRPVWTFNAGKVNTGGGRNFNGRYETVCIFAKGPGYTFNLKDVKVDPKTDDVRNPPDGVNPGDVWHFERTTNVTKGAEGLDHECIFPYDLVERVILAFSKPGDLVVDPFAGSGQTMRVAAALGRKCTCIEINKQFADTVKIMMNQTPFAQEDA